MQKALRIAVQVETTRAHGRAMLEGIADAALNFGDWRLESVEPRLLTDPANVRRYDGLIVRVMDSATADAILRAKRPAVGTYGRLDPNPLPFIRLDDEAIAKHAAECFAEHRYMRCAYCGFHGLRFSAARGEAFARLVSGLGGTCATYDGSSTTKYRDTFVRNERMDRIADIAALRRWVKALPKPIAVFCCNDMRAFHLMQACADAKIDVPREVAVLGVDNDKVLCTFSNPPLSSIDTDAFALGQTAARMLDELIASPGRPVKNMLHCPTGIVDRTSTESYPVKTPWLSDALVYIRRNLGNGISANDVISHLGYSHTAVNNAFRREIGSSVQQEVMRQRRERACRMLKETDMTAAEIAKLCGYPSAQYFAHRFAAEFGTTPNAWRRGGRQVGQNLIDLPSFASLPRMRGLVLPARTMSARGSSTYSCTTRLSGRAPRAESVPLSTRKSDAFLSSES